MNLEVRGQKDVFYKLATVSAFDGATEEYHRRSDSRQSMTGQRL